MLDSLPSSTRTRRHDLLPALLRRAAGGDRRAREQAITATLPLARKLAARYARPEVPMEDLIQVAAVGVVKAVDRWDPARGGAFAGFAVPTILGELRRYFRQNSWTVRPTRELQELWLAAERTRDALTSELRRRPTVEELAAALGRPDEEVLEALFAGSTRESVSLDATHDDDDENGRPLESRLGSPDTRLLQVDDRGAVRDLLSALPQRDRAIVWLRFRHDLTQSEIGDYFGVSQMHVSRILRRSLETMRRGQGSVEVDPTP